MYVQDEETVNIYLSVHAIKANWLDWYGDCCLNKDARKFKVSFYVAVFDYNNTLTGLVHHLLQSRQFFSFID